VSFDGRKESRRVEAGGPVEEAATLAVHQKAEVGEEVGTNDGAGDVGDDKTPRKVPM
jgi:hypothetical protein